MGMGSALYIMRFIQPLYNELRKYILAYQFADETEEISFFSVTNLNWQTENEIFAVWINQDNEPPILDIP